MNRVTQLVFLVALAVSALRGQEVPLGTAGEQGSVARPMALRVGVSHVPVTWSACGTANVDGVLSPGEWSGATSHTITVNTAAGAVPATLHVMNDNLTLYVALRFPESARNYGSLGIEFDNDNDGVPFETGDDAIVYNNLFGLFDDFRTPCASGICAPNDTTDAGSNEGRGAYVNDGTNSVYEISHPFGSFDFSHDLSACPSGSFCGRSTVGFYILLRQIESSGAIHDTYYPDAAVYDQVTVQDCDVPVLSGCGTSSIDGAIASTEWAGAGQYRLSVNVTPRGDTAPGTLYLMNDSFNLYAALAFDQPAAHPHNQADIDFNNNPSTWIGDDHLFFSPNGGGFLDVVGVPCPPPPFGSPPCRSADTFVGGTNDGAGALANNRSQTAIEISHPLNSGDSHDFALTYGDTIQYRLAFSTADPAPPGSVALTVVPDRFLRAFADWRICTPGPTQNVSDLSQQVDSLGRSGALSPKNADTLNKDLIKANENLQIGKLKQAANDLGKFISDVSKMMRKGELADRLGQPLIAAATSAISQL